ncbi:MAG: hypothetical protein R6W96_09465 [Clostridia bacterium]
MLRKPKWLVIVLVLLVVALAVLFCILLKGREEPASAVPDIRADFYVFQERAPEGAGGFLDINRMDGNGGGWSVQGEVWNLLPDTAYTVSAGYAGTREGNMELLVCTTDSSGNARFRQTVEDIPLDISIARIYRFDMQTELTAPRSEGYLQVKDKQDD